MRNLVIFGDTQFAERLSKYILIEGVDCVRAFTQEEQFMTRTEINGIPVIPFERLGDLLNEEFSVILGIGYTKMNSLKSKLYDLCKKAGYNVGSYISSKAIVYTNDFDEGTFVCPGAIIGPGCKLGKGNYLASAAILSHDNKLGDFNFLSTNVVLGGFAKVKDNCFFGLHCTIKDDILIESNCLIGSSANVLKSISQEGSVWVGNPARILVGKDSNDTKI